MTSDSGNNIKITPTTATLRFGDYCDHIMARLGIRRSKHLIEPGLYALGNPNEDSPVFVTANYTLSFDALRSAIVGTDGYILVLDTKGINVWCAAGKRTFGTDELVSRIETVSLSKVVNHKKLILPQLGAPGVAAHLVKEKTGFNVEYGPVFAKDLPEYLKTHKTTLEMRRVRFAFKDRLILVPVELVGVLLPMIIATVVLFFAGGFLPSAALVAAFLAGVVLFPPLLPWIPTPNFSTKGFILGGLAVLPFALLLFFNNPDAPLWLRTGKVLALLLALPPVTAFLTLNFTGASTFTSRSGVKREMYAYIPVMAWMFGGGIALSIALKFIN